MIMTGGMNMSLISIADDVRRELRELTFTARDGRMFALIVGLGALGVGWRFGWISAWYIVTVIVVLLSGIVIPERLRALYMIWMTIGLTIGWVMSRIILTFIYIIVITPLALVRRLSGSGSVDFFPRQDADSYWHQVADDQQDYLKQF